MNVIRASARFAHHRLVALVAMLALVPITAFAEPIGLVKVIAGTAHIERQGARIPAAVGVPLERTDRIVTGKDGRIGLSFADASTVSAGPDTVIDLERFSYDSTTRGGGFDVTLRRGTLSAVSGKLVAQTPGSMKVKTPTSVLAVRGTEFVVSVDPGAGSSSEDRPDKGGN